MTAAARARATVLGLAAGDSLGSTSEFRMPTEVDQVLRDFPGWPGKQVGRGGKPWELGEPTDDTDMAMAMLRSAAETKGWDLADICKRWVAWSQAGPKDIGITTRRVLAAIAGGREPFLAGHDEYRARPNNAANGSLMRNGVVPALDTGLLGALDHTVLHGLPTHFQPLPMVCCVLHTALCHRAIHGGGEVGAPTEKDLEDILRGPWEAWKQNGRHPLGRSWLKGVEDELGYAERQCLRELKGFADMDPYTLDYRGQAGYAVLTLKIALWALAWSFRPGGERPAIPRWLPEEPFAGRGFDTIAWVAMIGADADTYGATAGALLGAHHPEIPEAYLEGLWVRDEVELRLTEAGVG